MILDWKTMATSTMRVTNPLQTYLLILILEKNGMGIRFDGNQTVSLVQDYSTFDIKGAFSACLWVKSEDFNADILDSGRFSIKVRDGFLWGQAQVGGLIKKTEAIAMPTETWFHLIISWDEKTSSLHKQPRGLIPY